MKERLSGEIGPETVVNPEYLRRNLLVCKAVGANANAKAALKRLQAMRRPQKWLTEYLQGIIDRTESLPGELACYRSAVPYSIEQNGFSSPTTGESK